MAQRLKRTTAFLTWNVHEPVTRGLKVARGFS